MAKTGITYTEVDEAARYLQGQGRNPTVDAIRERLGTGSRTTLGEHLKRWKGLQTDSKGQLPEPLLGMVKGLWDSLQSLAEQRVEEHQSIAHQEVSTLKSQLHTLQQAELQLHQEYHQLQETLDTEKRLQTALAKQLQDTEASKDKLNALHQAAQQQLEEAKQENQRLHKLAMQIQANHEHYQQAIQQQQLEQSLAKEQQYASFNQEISQLKSELKEARLQATTIEKTAETKQTQLQQLQIEHNQLTERYQALLLKQQDSETLLIQLQGNEKMQQKQLEKSDRDLLAERQLSQSLNQQVAVLSEQLKRAQTDVTQAADKIEALRQEKLFLVQEKSQLDGAIKQLTRK